MAFLNAEMLIEFVIRVGTNDVIKDPSLIDSLFETNLLQGMGRDLAPEGSTTPNKELLIMDYFQQKIAELPPRASETGGVVFRNSIPLIPDIKKFLSQANMNIIHGFPRQPGDLPAISITLGNEDIAQQYLGRIKMKVNKATDGKDYYFFGADSGSQYNVSIITTNYDELCVWYNILKLAFTIYGPIMEAYGLRNNSMSWLDIEPGPEYLEAGIFVYQRTCILKGDKEEFVPIPSNDKFTELSFTVTENGNPTEGGKELIPGEDELGPGEYE